MINGFPSAETKDKLCYKCLITSVRPHLPQTHVGRCRFVRPLVYRTVKLSDYCFFSTFLIINYMPVVLVIIPLFVGYEFIASKVNESVANTERKEREDFIKKNPNNSVNNGQYATPNTNLYFAPKRIHLPKLTNWFSQKPS
jgi:hypothetical protein